MQVEDAVSAFAYLFTCPVLCLGLLSRSPTGGQQWLKPHSCHCRCQPFKSCDVHGLGLRARAISQALIAAGDDMPATNSPAPSPDRATMQRPPDGQATEAETEAKVTRPSHQAKSPGQDIRPTHQAKSLGQVTKNCRAGGTTARASSDNALRRSLDGVAEGRVAAPGVKKRCGNEPAAGGTCVNFRLPEIKAWGCQAVHA